MSRFSGFGVCSTALVALALAAPSLAGAAPITGQLDRPGYTVIAMAASGEARTAVAPDGGFSLVPPAAVVTLHMRAPDGTYAGPIVVRPTKDFALAEAKLAVERATLLVTRRRSALRRAERRVSRARTALRRADGAVAVRRARRELRAAKTQRATARTRLRRAKRKLTLAKTRLEAAQAVHADIPNWAVLGVRAGAPLGAVAINSVGGYAKAAKMVRDAWEKWAVPAVRAQAAIGTPIGAGNFGLVRSQRADGGAIGDTDLDAVPDPLDIDDDGDLVLDGYDSPARAGAAQAGGDFPDGSRLDIHADLLVFDFQPLGPVNVNGGSSDTQIAEAQTLYGELTFFWFADAGSAELDCGSLLYCSAGGSGRIPPPQGSIFRSQGLPFPECCDGDGDGLGTLTQAGRAAGFGPGSGAMTLWHGATIDQIDSGDVLISRGTSNGVPFESVKTVGFVFSTPPVLAAYDDAQGNTATFTYPRPSPTPDTPVKAGPGGDIVLSLALWRPQRERLADERGSSRWMDIGHLVYYVDVFVSETEGAYCPLSSLSTTDPELTPTQVTHSPGIEAGAFTDLAPDQPPNPVNTVAFTLNLTQCLASKGVTLDSGETAQVNFHAVAFAAGGQRAEARSDIPFKRQP